MLGAVAAVVAVLHGWGLERATGPAREAPTRVAAAPVAALDTRSIAPQPISVAGPAAAPAEPVAAAMARPVRSPRPAAPTAPQPAAAAAVHEAEPPADEAAADDMATPVETPPPEAAAPAEAHAAAEPPSASPSDPSPGTPDAAAVLAAGAAATGAAATAPAAAATAPPVYPTRLAAPFVARYALQRGMISGSGSLRWAPGADGRYDARLEGSVAGFNVLDWRSAGQIDRAGIAPERFLIQRRGRDAQAANFQRGIGKITYSGPSVQYDLPPGAQDRLSWMLQIGGVLNAAPKRFGVGSQIDFFVSGARGDADLWRFSVVGLESVRAGGRDVMALKLAREPRKPYDTRVEVWLDPAREHRPVRARLVNGRDDEALDLRLDE